MFSIIGWTFQKQGKTFVISFGKTDTMEHFDHTKSSIEWAGTVKDIVYELANNLINNFTMNNHAYYCYFWSINSIVWKNEGNNSSRTAKADWSRTTADKFHRKTNKADNEIYILTYHDSPNIMREIGRLRELTFRTAGGGIGEEVGYRIILIPGRVSL